MVALYDFEPQAGATDQLPLRSGQNYTVIRKDNTGWWIVMNPTDQRRGMAPAAYLGTRAVFEAMQLPEYHGRPYQHEIEAALDKERPGTYLLHENPKVPGEIMLTMKCVVEGGGERQFEVLCCSACGADGDDVTFSCRTKSGLASIPIEQRLDGT